MAATTPQPEGALLDRLVASWLAPLRERLGKILISLGQRLTGQSATATGGDRFASLASMIPGVVYQRIVSQNGDIRYTYMSEGSREVFGVAPEEVLKDSEVLFKTYSDDYKASFRQKLIAASNTLTKWDVEASIVAPDGQIRFTHAIANPERLPDGSVLWTGLILDATRIKKAEDELKAANRSVEAANKAKSMFLANMSHEIRTPMNGVLGMADLLLKTGLTARQNRLLHTLKHSAQTLLAIINDVLDISRIEAGRFSIENEDFNLRLCLEDALDLCAGAAYHKGLELNLIVDENLPTLVKGDVGRLRQVLINLLGNAVKFTSAGEATLRAGCTHSSDGYVQVTIDVIDTGIGIDAAAKEKLFAPFAQADSSITRRFGGTGLGLAITRHLVTLMGGDVDLESEIGKGTKVTVRLAMQAVADTDAATRALAGKRILIVDDRSRVRETLASKLYETGAEIEMAGSESEATAMIDAAFTSGNPFCAIIIDRLQPGSESIEVVRSIQRKPEVAGSTVIAVVSMNWRGDTVGAYTDIVALAKPVRRGDLLAALAFQISAPNRPDESTVAIAQSEIAAPANDERLDLHVLVAEDNPVNQEVAREYLGAFGCTVVVVENGEEAVAAANARDYDIVLMDCQMPVLDGLSAVRQIRAGERRCGNKAVPIIAVTANAYESDRVDALAAGMDDYLVKPFSDDALRAMIEKWKASSPRWRRPEVHAGRG